MSFKKLITLSTASIIALSIAACGDSESGDPVTPQSSDSVLEPG